MSDIHLTTVRSGNAGVMRGSHNLGQVTRISWPTQRANGEVSSELRWEARAPWQIGEVNAYGYPTFRTRAEAVAHLAETH
ncbi:hypothetical protein HMPREF1301_00249 [Propionibacterium sp. KPL2005]|nr:hypothetical protein HMPREF1301_00249 [Propionibacterium sp. KPL2005]ERS26763.1 hypothetical protein HMPREF1297_02353 [Propionibacterium sp. KPL2000]